MFRSSGFRVCTVKLFVHILVCIIITRRRSEMLTGDDYVRVERFLHHDHRGIIDILVSWLRHDFLLSFGLVLPRLLTNQTLSRSSRIQI